MFTKINSYLRRLKILVIVVKNWPLALLIKVGMKSEASLKLRNDQIFSLRKSNWNDFLELIFFLYYFPDGSIKNNIATFNYRGRTVNFCVGDGVGMRTMVEIFGGDIYRTFYKMASVKGCTVLDIGSAFGDTALSFLFEGASFVYGVEANPGWVDLARKNLMLNGLSGQAVFVNAIVNAENGENFVSYSISNMFNLSKKNTIKNQDAILVPKVTISSLVNQFKLNDAILKMDIEGYEYQIILNSDLSTLRKFKYMVIEYHYGFEKLKSHLEEAGFKVAYTLPHESYMPDIEEEHLRMFQVGDIYAVRI